MPLMEARVAEFDYEKIPVLEIWISSTEARGLLKVTKQGMHAMITSGRFAYDDLRRFDEDGRPRILLRKTVVDELAEVREAEAAEAEAAAKEAEKRKFHHDVRVWARSRGIVVRNDRPPPNNLIRRYRAHLREQQSAG